MSRSGVSPVSACRNAGLPFRTRSSAERAAAGSPAATRYETGESSSASSTTSSSQSRAFADASAFSRRTVTASCAAASGTASTMRRVSFGTRRTCVFSAPGSSTSTASSGSAEKFAASIRMRPPVRRAFTMAELPSGAPPEKHVVSGASSSAGLRSVTIRSWHPRAMRRARAAAAARSDDVACPVQNDPKSVRPLPSEASTGDSPATIHRTRRSGRARISLFTNSAPDSSGDLPPGTFACMDMESSRITASGGNVSGVETNGAASAAARSRSAASSR